MSNQDPGSDPTMENLEIVGRPPRSHTGSARRYFVAFVVAALGAGAVGAGVWAWQAWAKQGPQPAAALPGNTLAYAALDLDPPGGQKVAAYNTLRKFPSLTKELGLGSADDLTKSVVDELASEGDCDLDYRDVKPWMGDRVAVAVVAQVRPEPVVVLQVKDADQARAGLRAAGRGCDGTGFGFVVDGEWAVLARNDDVAAQVKRDADRANLDDDKEFRALTGAAGDPGLVTLYAAPEAGKALFYQMEKDPFVVWSTTEMLNLALDPMSSYFGLAGMAVAPDFGEGSVSSSEVTSDVSPELRKAEARLNKRFEHFDELSKKEQRRLLREQDKLFEKMYGPMDDEAPSEEDFAEDDVADEFPTPELDPALRTALHNFTGFGGVGRFADSGLEIEVVGDSLKGAVGDMYAGSAGDDTVSRLPADTAFAFGAGLADGWVDSLMGQLNQQYLFSGPTEADTIKAFEKSTGLDVPGDLEALGGEGISMVAGSGLDPEQLFEDLAQAPVAVRISGDPDRIEAAVDKLRAGIGSGGGPKLLSRRVGDDVVVGVNAAYLEHLAKEGGDELGDSDLFHKVVPDADKAPTVYFMDFDAGDWLAKAVGSDGDRKDVEPLEASGLTVTKDKGEQRILFRLSFDD
jgi:hypothetical protein